MRRLFQNRIRFLAAITAFAIGGLLQTTAGQAYCRSEFYRYFRGMEVAGARVNPMERAIFSVLLSETKTHERPESVSPSPARRF